jgi:hypothetical protein
MVTKKKMREPDPLPGLPFVANNGRGNARNSWDVTSTGDYAKDCELGREYAKAALLHMLMEDEPHLLTEIVLDMIENFQHFPQEEWEISSLVNAKGIIIGFMNEMGEHTDRAKFLGQLSGRYEAVGREYSSISRLQQFLRLPGYERNR